MVECLLCSLAEMLFPCLRHKVDTNATLYNYHLAWKTDPKPFQPQFEALVAQGLEHMFCRICDFVSRKQGGTHARAAQ